MSQNDLVLSHSATSSQVTSDDAESGPLVGAESQKYEVGQAVSDGPSAADASALSSTASSPLARPLMTSWRNPRTHRQNGRNLSEGSDWGGGSSFEESVDETASSEAVDEAIEDAAFSESTLDSRECSSRYDDDVLESQSFDSVLEDYEGRGSGRSGSGRSGYNGCHGRRTDALWSGTNKNRDVSTGPFARPFAHSLAPLNRSLAPDCSLPSRP